MVGSGRALVQSLTSSGFVRTNAPAFRRPESVPILANVTSRSANLRNSLALVTVVLILSYLISDVAIFRIMSIRCRTPRPSLFFVRKPTR